MESETSGQVLVPLSKVKITLLLLGSAAVDIIALWLWANADHIPYRNPLYIQAVAIASTGFSGLCGLYYLRKIFDTAPGLVIDPEGVIDNSSGTSVGRILWSEICGFDVHTVGRQRFLTIKVRDPQKFLQQVNFLRRQILAANKKYWESPIQISSNCLKVDFDHLVKLFADSYAKYGISPGSGPVKLAENARSAEFGH
jgi:hypothetical protein